MCQQVAFMSVMGLWSKSSSLRIEEADVAILKSLTDVDACSSSSSSSSSGGGSDMLPLFYRIIMRNKQTLQKSSFKCISIYNIPGIAQHSNHISRLIDDESFKNELVVFATGVCDPHKLNPQSLTYLSQSSQTAASQASTAPTSYPSSPAFSSLVCLTEKAAQAAQSCWPSAALLPSHSCQILNRRSCSLCATSCCSPSPSCFLWAQLQNLPREAPQQRERLQLCPLVNNAREMLRKCVL